MPARRMRVLAYVTRVRAGRKELLVFDHQGNPDAGTQVPAGRLDPGESLEDGLGRELLEESGLQHVRVLRELQVAGAWVAESRYEDHAFEVSAEDANPPDTWQHVVFGDGDDAGLVFEYRWVPLRRGVQLWNGLDATYEALL